MTAEILLGKSPMALGPWPVHARWWCVASILAVLVTGLVTDAGGSSPGAPRSDGSDELRVVVTERPGAIRLHVFLPWDVAPRSVEVEVTGRLIVVFAQDLAGRRRRSGQLEASQIAVGEGARVDYESDGSLTIILRTIGGP